MTTDYTMKGIFQGDLIITAILKLGLDDMRKNPYLIEDVFSSLKDNPILNKVYGQKEIDRAKEYIIKNDIPIFMHHRVDKLEYPCITISLGPSIEDINERTLGDSSVITEDLTPKEIGKPIAYIVQPFKAVSYDKSTGIIEIPTNIDEYKYVYEGMSIINSKTGYGYTIIGKAGTHGIKIAENSELETNDTLAIIPQYVTYQARRGHATSNNTYSIGCHVSGDVMPLIYLFSVVKYILWRYKESLLEYNNFQKSSIQCSDIIKIQGQDYIYSRMIELSGQVDESWLKTPERFLEAIDFYNSDGETDRERVGIKILAQDAPDGIDPEDELWITVDDE